MNWKRFRIPVGIIGALALIFLIGAYAYSCTYVYLEPSLPTLAQMRNVKLKVPLRVYTAGGELMAEFGTKRRSPVQFDQIPPLVKDAFLAAEDHNFFHEGAFDPLSLLRAAVVDLIEGRKAEGGSTITMEAARNLFLTLAKTWRRKIQESFVAYELDHHFSKQDVFQLYVNVIFFGERAYGIAAAAQTYYGKTLDQLTLPEAATLAGLVEAPSLYNPIVHPHLAQIRRSYVLTRMLALGYITAAQAKAANAAPIVARLHAPRIQVHAPYVAAMVLKRMAKRYGPAAETAGYSVFTTIDGRLQSAANRAVQLGMIAYSRQFGWRGPIGHTVVTDPASRADLQSVVDEYRRIGVLLPAVVVQVGLHSAKVYARDHGFGVIGWSGLSWAGSYRTPGPMPKTAGQVLAPGDVIYVVWKSPSDVALAQVPLAQAALVSLDPNNGGIAALVGGFDYYNSKFNRATQAWRQPGSGFKPFYYSAAIKLGYTPASTFLDAPLVTGGLGSETTWRPVNYADRFSGPVRMRVALAHSINLVSIRILRAVGLPYATRYVARFGFSPKQIPQNLTVALGSLSVTPMQMAAAYSVFANGGYRVKPFLIERIVNAKGKVVWQAKPRIACHGCSRNVSLSQYASSADNGTLRHGASALRGDGARFMPPGQIAPRVISADNDYIMTSMMRSVIQFGTGVAARALGRDDIAGKTGTTNNFTNAWFNGFTPNLVAVVWTGFDDNRSLGNGEQGAAVALPIWIRYMRMALTGVPQWRRPQPPGIVRLRVSPRTGRLVSDEDPNGIEEVFMAKHLPEGASPQTRAQSSAAASIF